MSGGGKGGKQTSTQTVKIPAWLENAAKQNMARADEIAKIGYVPYYGPDVAAFSPMQQAAFQNTGDAAAAFGMAAPADPMAGMPAPQTFAGGVQGYSSQPMFQQSVDALAAQRPGQYAKISGMFVDPVTGRDALTPFGSGGAQAQGKGRGGSLQSLATVLGGGGSGVGGSSRPSGMGGGK